MGKAGENVGYGEIGGARIPAEEKVVKSNLSKGPKYRVSPLDTGLYTALTLIHGFSSVLCYTGPYKVYVLEFYTYCICVNSLQKMCHSSKCFDVAANTLL